MFKSCKIDKKSVPLHYINECGSSSVGRAWASQAQGRGFEPRLPLTESQAIPSVWHFSFPLPNQTNGHTLNNQITVSEESKAIL